MFFCDLRVLARKLGMLLKRGMGNREWGMGNCKWEMGNGKLKWEIEYSFTLTFYNVELLVFT